MIPVLPVSAVLVQVVERLKFVPVPVVLVNWMLSVVPEPISPAPAPVAVMVKCGGVQTGTLRGGYADKVAAPGSVDQG